MMRVLPVLLLLAACGGGEAPPPPTDVAAVPPAGPPPAGVNPAPVATSPTPGAPGTDAPRYTLVALQNGDHACYVVLKDAAGAELNLPGSLDLCAGGGVDATPFIGKTVTLDRNKSMMAAASCQGKPECKDTEEVDLVVGVRVIP